MSLDFLVDAGSPFGAALAVYFLMRKETDKIKACINRKHNRNSRYIAYIMGKLGIKPSDIE